MKIKELIYQTPEMTEEKLLEIIEKHTPMMRKEVKERLHQLHKTGNLAQAFLTEYDLIQDKKSYLTKGQRDQVVGFVGMCIIQMAKGNEGNN